MKPPSARLLVRRLSIVSLVLVVAGVFALPFLGCSTSSDGEDEGRAIWSPPGAVASFLAAPGEPKAARVYDGRTWAEIRQSVGHTSHRGLEKVVCRDCHRGAFQKAGSGACGRAGCHEAQAAQSHGAVDAEERSECTTCHSFSPGKPQPACMECHVRSAAFAADAAPAVPAGARRDGGAAPAVTDGHQKADCLVCHGAHRKDPRPAAGDCLACHTERASSHAGHKDTKGCADCHAPHTPASAAKATCAGCHHEPAGERPAGHAACVTCHDPHADAKLARAGVAHAPRGGTVPCASCHADKKALLADKVVQHAVCTSCHARHNPRAVGAAVCTPCHTKVSVSHDTHGLTSAGASVNACTACHPAHPPEGAPAAVPCTRCHGKIARHDRGHGASVACTECHGKHDFHAPAKPAAAMCARCHEGQARVAAAFVGHSNCVACHVATHDAGKVAPCGSCHAAQEASAPRGHRACATCHTSHGPKVLAQATCPGCHAKNTAGPHRVVKGGCDTCHRPHGPGRVAAPPACATCHEIAKLPGLHAKPTHQQQCTRCHSVHAAANPARETCTSACHVDRRGHQPEARRCDGCHYFGALALRRR